jgi:hypothetical protein
MCLSPPSETRPGSFSFGLSVPRAGLLHQRSRRSTSLCPCGTISFFWALVFGRPSGLSPGRKPPIRDRLAPRNSDPSGPLGGGRDSVC